MGSLFLVRHATTAASASGRNLGQASNPPLADAGHRLAKALARTLVAELEELPHDEMRLLSSPARRCRETMAPIASALGIAADEIETDPGLLEIEYGAWEGLTADEARARDPEHRARWELDPYATACPDGESGADVAARAARVLEPVEGWLAADRSRCAIVVAHNHVNRVRMCALLGWPMRDYRRRIVADPGGYSLITFGSAGPVVRRVNSPAV